MRVKSKELKEKSSWRSNNQLMARADLTFGGLLYILGRITMTNRWSARLDGADKDRCPHLKYDQSLTCWTISPFWEAKFRAFVLTSFGAHRTIQKIFECHDG